jgi:MtN3 and saliva related transmembrane protein
VVTVLAISAATWGIAMAVSPVLQIRKIVHHRSSHGVSVGYMSVLFVGFLLWLSYGNAL